MLLSVMQVRVLSFGVLKDWLGGFPATVDLAEGATAADLLERLEPGSPVSRHAGGGGFA
jgi:hypothetical protein